MRPYPPGYDFPWPFGGWHSLLGPSCSHCGFGPSFRRSSGLLARGQTALGLPRSAPVETRRGRVPPILRGLGAPACRRWHALIRRRSRSGSWPSHRRVSHRLRRPFVTQPQRRFICIHPSRLSLTRLAWMVQARLGLHPSALARHVTGALARVGNRPGHWSGSVWTHHRPLIWCDFVSHSLYVKLATFGAPIPSEIYPWRRFSGRFGHSGRQPVPEGVQVHWSRAKAYAGGACCVEFSGRRGDSARVAHRDLLPPNGLAIPSLIRFCVTD
jgi:hypothetical protein